MVINGYLQILTFGDMFKGYERGCN